jgi:nitronate monooxygenase
MTLATSLTRRLGIEHPVLLAPMDLVADAALTTAVSRAGGFGILGGGYGDPDWLTGELDRLDAAEVRYGVGFITWSLAGQPGLLDLVLARQPAAVMLSFGDPAPFVERIRRAGAVAICQVQSIAMARDAVAAGAEILVAQGTEGGGHGATRSMSTLVPEMVDAVADRVPVVAAGGLADGRGLAAALMLGAAGVLMGTRFYATREAAGTDAAKERITGVGGDATVRGKVFDITRRKAWPAPFTGRCLANAFTAQWSGRELELLQRVEQECARYDAARAAGDYEVLAVIAGEASGLIHEIAAAAGVVEGVVAEAEALLAGASRRFGIDAAALA